MLVLTHAVHIALSLWWLLFVIEYECLFLYSHSVISSICLHLQSVGNQRQHSRSLDLHCAATLHASVKMTQIADSPR
ncbi:hypothetical protein EDD86DRAFT_72533 [Gorgonomyces haynaldii]|nr:hypothetical protein EDD86DRAFT_72533 [Gorgonomyces haynaldii]